jgi:hypothetical protein
MASMCGSLSEGVGGGGGADAAQQVVQLAELVVGEVDGAGEAGGEVGLGDAGAEGGALVGEVDVDGAFVGGAAFAADEALGLEAFEQGREGAAVEGEGAGEVADGRGRGGRGR